MRHHYLMVLAAAHAAKAPPQKPVAVCVTGLARAFHAVDRVHRNIWSHMVWPIVPEADVFFVLDDATAGRAGVRAGQASDTHIKEEARTLWRPVYDVALRSRGIEESLSMCHGAIVARERFLRKNYTWVLRLRPDATYRTHLPSYDEWPLASNVAWAPAVGGGEGACSRGVVQDAETRGVCVDDGWALMGRKAADAYFFGSEWPARHSQTTDCHQTHCAECRLGCALFRAGVRAGSINIELHLERPESVGGSYAPTAKRDAVDVAAETAIKAALNGAGAADLAARFATSVDGRHALAFLVGEVCRGAYVQVPFTASASIGAAPAIHGFAAPLWTAASGCPGPPSS